MESKSAGYTEYTLQAEAFLASTSKDVFYVTGTYMP